MRRYLKTLMTAAALVLILFLSSARPSAAQTPQPEGYPVHIYFFWGAGCPHCAKAKPYLEGLAAQHPEIVLHSYEVYYDENSQQVFANITAYHQIEISGVPAMFIGPYYVVGYSEEMNPEIENVVVACIQNGCLNAGAGVVPGEVDIIPTLPASTATPAVTPTSGATPTPAASPTPTPGLGASNQLEVPLIGVVNLDQQSLAISTALIALVDGFNPCSLWVLTMLMALVLHTGSRKKVLVIGLIFIAVTAAIYALFIAGLFSVLRVVSFMGWVQVLVAVIALVFAVVNIKDYFWYKKGVSFTISDQYKPGIFQKIRRVIASDSSIWSLAGATVVMAAGVSLVEFSCTAGFPVIWSNLLISQSVSAASFILLLLLYLLIYQIDELIIFVSVVVTLKASRLEEKQGRALKLFGGVLMLALAIVMLADPSLMNRLDTSIAIFAASFSVAALILIIHRQILPQLSKTDQSKAYSDTITPKNGEK